MKRVVSLKKIYMYTITLKGQVLTSQKSNTQFILYGRNDIGCFGTWEGTGLEGGKREREVTSVGPDGRKEFCVVTSEPEYRTVSNERNGPYEKGEQRHAQEKVQKVS